MKKNSWIYKVFLLTFFLSILFSTITNLIAYHTNLLIIFISLILVIVVGIVFDMLGTASLTCKVAYFHIMSAQKIKGAKEAISVLKNNVRFANICNDVIGDVCGIVSGGLGSVLAVSLSKVSSVSLTILSVILAAFISAFTVGGKAVFKGVAIKNCNQIIFAFGKLKSLFHVK